MADVTLTMVRNLKRGDWVWYEHSNASYTGPWLVMNVDFGDFNGSIGSAPNYNNGVALLLWRCLPDGSWDNGYGLSENPFKPVEVLDADQLSPEMRASAAEVLF